MPRLSALLLTGVVLVGCGGGNMSHTPSQVQAADGNWTAPQATPATGPTLPTFTFTMKYCCGSMMNMSQFQMATTTACFGPGSVMTTTGQMSGGMMGPGTQITMDLWSDAAHTGNHLNMVMVMNAAMTGMTGTYTLTGVTPGCSSGSGTISMSRQ